MENLFNIDADVLYSLTSFLGIMVFGAILCIIKRIVVKTSTKKDDEFVEKLMQINKENLKKVKKK